MNGGVIWGYVHIAQGVMVRCDIQTRQGHNYIIRITLIVSSEMGWADKKKGLYMFILLLVSLT